MTLGEKLVKARTALGLTQTQVAGDRITRNMLSQLEHDTASPSVKTLEYLAQVLQVPISWLLNEPPQSPDEALSEAQALFRQEQYEACMSLLQITPVQLSEEKKLMYLRCSLELSKQALDQADFRKAETFAADSIACAQECIYATSADLTAAQIIIVQCRLHAKCATADDLQLLNQYYKTLGAEEARHLVLTRFYLSEFNTQAAERELWLMSDLSSSSKGEYLLLRGMVELQKTRNTDAMLYFRQAEQEALSRPQQIELFESMEQCCKEEDDFKGAYQYAVKRLALITQDN